MALTKVTGSVIKDSVSLSGNVSVGGTLTYQDVTNVDALGIGTFRTGIKVLSGQVDVGSNIKLGNAGIITATELDISGDIDIDGHTNLDNVSVAGVTTFSEDTKFIGALSGRDLQWDKSDNTLEFLDYTAAKFGTDNNLTIYHNAGNNNTYITESGAGSLLIGASDLYFQDVDSGTGHYYMICATGGRVQLNFDNSEKLRTTNTGVTVTGTAIADALNVTGTSVVATLKSTNNNYVMQMQGNNATDKVYFGTTSGNDFIIANTSSVTERLRINSSGQLLLGSTSSANSGYKFESYSSGAYNIMAKSTNGNGGYHNFTGQASNGTITSYITHNGRGYFEDGIQFDSSGEVLDSYEEGTFTPAFSNGLVASGYSIQKGVYTKIGRYVFGTIILDLSTTSSQTTSVIDISGLPFTAGNYHTIDGESGGAHYNYQDGFYNANGFTGIVVSNNTIIRLYRADNGNFLTGTSVNGGRQIRMNFSYHAA